MLLQFCCLIFRIEYTNTRAWIGCSISNTGAWPGWLFYITFDQIHLIVTSLRFQLLRVIWHSISSIIDTCCRGNRLICRSYRSVLRQVGCSCVYWYELSSHPCPEILSLCISLNSDINSSIIDPSVVLVIIISALLIVLSMVILIYIDIVLNNWQNNVPLSYYFIC